MTFQLLILAKMLKYQDFSVIKLPDVVFILLQNVVGILTFMSRRNVMFG